MEGPQEIRKLRAISPLAWRVLMVAIVAGLFVLLYVLISGVRGPAPTPRFSVTIIRDGTNWLVAFRDVPGGRLPSEMYLLVRNASGGIALLRTSFADLTVQNWSAHGAEFIDGNPGVPEVQRGDGLRIDTTSYPPQSTLEISDRSALFLSQRLE